MTTPDPKERLERWRLLLGGDDADGIGIGLSDRALAMDRAMAALYDPSDPSGKSRRAGLGASAPHASACATSSSAPANAERGLRPTNPGAWARPSSHPVNGANFSISTRHRCQSVLARKRKNLRLA